MVGGERVAVTHLEPLLRALATDRGYVHAGPPGASHFVKLVHNGIEFGMMQAIGEGFDLLTHYHEPLDIDGVLDCWRHGSVIRSWLIGLLAEAYKADPRLEQPSSLCRGYRRGELAGLRCLVHGSAYPGHRAVGYAALRIAGCTEELGARHCSDAARLWQSPLGPGRNIAQRKTPHGEGRVDFCADTAGEPRR